VECPCEPLSRQGVTFQARSWHSLTLTANSEFNQRGGWSIGDSNPGPLACQASAATFSFGVLRWKSARLSTSCTPCVALIVVLIVVRASSIGGVQCGLVGALRKVTSVDSSHAVSRSLNS